ncbi:MAG: hypothetical protein JXR70_04525 [Spirochaetales bacterium]|nr:hypothetical protein [Spirochaetales bacterium]
MKKQIMGMTMFIILLAAVSLVSIISCGEMDLYAAARVPLPGEDGLPKEKTLFYVEGQQLWGAPLADATNQLAGEQYFSEPLLQDAKSIQIHKATASIYWCSGEGIYRKKASGSGMVETIIKRSSGDMIITFVIDSKNSRLFFIHLMNTNEILKAPLEPNTNATALNVSGAAQQMISDIAFDPNEGPNGSIVWLNNQNVPAMRRVCKFALDGIGQELYSPPDVDLQKLALMPPDIFFYYNNGTGWLTRVNYNMTTEPINPVPNIFPNDMVADPETRHLYFAKGGEIIRYNVDNRTDTPVRTEPNTVTALCVYYL